MCFVFFFLIQNNESINILIWFNDHLFIYFFTFWFAPSWRCLTKLDQNIAPNHFFNGVVHEQPWSPIVWLLCGYSIVSSFLGGINIFQICLPLSFAIAFVSWFPSSILLDFWKCLIFQNIGCLIKTLLKHCAQTIFQGGSPWATLIPSSMIVVWVLYCVQFFLGMNIFQIYVLLSFAIAFVSRFPSSILLGIKQVFPMDGPQSGSKSHDWAWFSIVWLLCGVLFCVHVFLGMNIFQRPSPFLIVAFVSYFVQFFWHPLLDSYGVSLGFLCDFHHNAKTFLWCFYDISMGFQKGAQGISMGFL